MTRSSDPWSSPSTRTAGRSTSSPRAATGEQALTGPAESPSPGAPSASMRATPSEITVTTGRGPATVTFWPRDWDALYGPQGGSIMTLDLDEDDVSSMPPAGEAEVDAMLDFLGSVLPEVLACTEGEAPRTWVPDPYAGCRLCPCSPGLVADAWIIIDGQVVDLEITAGES